MEKLIFKNGMPGNLLELEIPGERIMLRAVSDKYVDIMFREFDSEITKYMFPSPNEDIGQAQTFIDKSRKEMAAGHTLTFSFIDKDTGEFLGNGGLHTNSSPASTPELGLWIKKSAHGNKYGREAIHTLCNWARANLEFDYLIYPVARDNIASRKIPESLGGVIFKEEITQKANGEDMDTVVYKIDC